MILRCWAINKCRREKEIWIRVKSVRTSNVVSFVPSYCTFWLYIVSCYSDGELLLTRIHISFNIDSFLVVSNRPPKSDVTASWQPLVTWPHGDKQMPRHLRLSCFQWQQHAVNTATALFWYRSAWARLCIWNKLLIVAEFVVFGLQRRRNCRWFLLSDCCACTVIQLYMLSPAKKQWWVSLRLVFLSQRSLIFLSCFSATMNSILDFFPVGIPVGCHMSYTEG